MAPFRRLIAAAVAALTLVVAAASPVFADTVNVTGHNTGQASTATVVCEFNSQTNTFTFTITNTSAITQPGSTSTITAIGFDLPPTGNASASGLNGFTGQQAPSLSSNFDFSDAALGDVPIFSAAVLDFGFTTGTAGTFDDGETDDGLLPGESASFTVSGAAFTGFTETQICNAIAVRYEDISAATTTDVGVTAGSQLAAYQPDARIRKVGGTLRGDDVYNTTGVGQRAAAAAAAGAHRGFYLSIQNDGTVADSFSLDVDGVTTPNGYVVRYYRGDSDEEITSAVQSDSFVTPELQPDQAYRIRIDVKIQSSAAVGSRLVRTYTFTSESDSNAQDTVKLSVRRK